MRPAMSLVFLLVILIATRSAKAIRLLLEEDTAVSVLQGEAPESRNFIQEGSGASKCDTHCSETRRKLLDNVTAISKSKGSSGIGVEGAGSKHHTKEEVGRNTESLQIAAPAVWKKPETYPDILDIAGMDYSPAKRRPPIHN